MSHFATLGLARHFDIAAGRSGEAMAVNLNGRANVATSLVPVAFGNAWNTVQPASATALRVKAGGNANDTAAGSGAREVTIVGLDETGDLVSEAVATAGASASAATTATFTRLLKAYVSASGTYGAVGGLSHAATITIENGGGGTDWGVIDATSIARAESEIGCYSIPLGYVGFLEYLHVQVESTKTVTFGLLARESILQAAAPYKAFRQIKSMTALGDEGLDLDFRGEPIFLPELSDIMPMAVHASTTAYVSVQMGIALARVA